MQLFASVLLFAALLSLASSAKKAPYDSSFAYLQVTSKESGQSQQFCMNYQQFRSKAIAPTPEESVPLNLEWWGAPNKTNLCEGTEATSFINATVPFQYRQTEACGRLGQNFSLGAIINYEIDELTTRMASAGLALVDKGRNFTGRWNDYLFSEFYDPDVRANQTLPLFYIYYETFAKEVLSIGASDDLELRFYRPPPLPIDPSMFIIWSVAMFCVLVGGISASRNYSRLSKCISQHDSAEESNSSAVSTSNADSSSQAPVNGQAQKSEVFGGDLCTNVVAVSSLMIIVVGILLLGFFFRSSMVTLFNVVLVVAGTFAVRSCLMDLISCICGFEDVEMGFTINNGILRKFFPERPKVVSSILLALSLGLCVFWFVNRSHPFAFILLDGINVAICIYVLKGMYFPNLKWLTIILTCMFVYDIFMVFGTPMLTSSGCSVMVEVASGNDCSSKASDKRGYPVAPLNTVIPERMPVLFLVPRLNDPMISCVDLSVQVEYHPVMLGLGDVIVPGYLIGFCFTADVVFNSMLGYGAIASIGYGLGLVVTFVSLVLTQTAQPALIYLIPFSLFPVILAALCRGQLGLLWTGEHVKTLKEIVRKNESSEEEPAPV